MLEKERWKAKQMRIMLSFQGGGRRMNDQEAATTIHFSELPPSQPGSVLFREWETYRREVGRLLAEGHEGKYLLIKGETIVGLWNSLGEAEHVASERYLLQPVLIHQIRTHEPVRRGPILFNQCHR
jgi:hypothetical protein